MSSPLRLQPKSANRLKVGKHPKTVLASKHKLLLELGYCHGYCLRSSMNLRLERLQDLLDLLAIRGRQSRLDLVEHRAQADILLAKEINGQWPKKEQWQGSIIALFNTNRVY